MEWRCIGDSSEDESSTALAKRVRQEYADKDDECEDKAAAPATSFVSSSVNADGMDEAECGSSTCMPGVIAKFGFIEGSGWESAWEMRVVRLSAVLLHFVQ